MDPIRIGCSGWNYDSWRGGIYPEGLAQRRWLERYAELFDTVEVNSTFYRLASRTGVERWVEQTPQDFVFAVKASQYVTHMKRLREMEPESRASTSGSSRSWRPDGSDRSSGSSRATSFQTYEMTADFTLVRSHYGHRGRRGNYPQRELDDWASRLRDWSRRVEVFAYFNNDWEQFAPLNAQGLARRLGVAAPV